MSVSIPFSSRACVRYSSILSPPTTTLADPLLQSLLASHHTRPHVGNQAPRSVRCLGILRYILIPKSNKKIMLLLSMSNIMAA
jgi:hypothetical protein